jgi:hypothetical protein
MLPIDSPRDLALSLRRDGEKDNNYAESNFHFSQDGLIVNNWNDTWLDGIEYYNMLAFHPYYSWKYQFQMYEEIPEFIYSEPKNGMIFYIKNFRLENICFPRITGKKKAYKWRKENLPVHLPKNSPKVSYIVASTTQKCSEQISFRLHFVTLYDECKNLMLCHLLQISPKPDILIDCFYHSNQLQDQKTSRRSRRSYVDPNNANVQITNIIEEEKENRLSYSILNDLNIECELNYGKTPLQTKIFNSNPPTSQSKELISCTNEDGLKHSILKMKSNGQITTEKKEEINSQFLYEPLMFSSDALKAWERLTGYNWHDLSVLQRQVANEQIKKLLEESNDFRKQILSIKSHKKEDLMLTKTKKVVKK